MAHFASRVHGEQSNAHIHCFNTQSGCGDRTNCRSARRGVIRHEVLCRNSCRLASTLSQSHSDPVGCIALLGIDLEDGASAHDRVM